MSYLKENTSIVRGTDLFLNYPMKFNKAPIDISSWEFYLSVSKESYTGKAIISKITSDALLSSDISGVTNTFQFHLNANDTKALEPYMYYFIVQVKNSRGTFAIHKARLTIEPNPEVL